MDLSEYQIHHLGPARIPSPLKNQFAREGYPNQFTSDSEKITAPLAVDTIQKYLKEFGNIPSFELAGPRENIFFDPQHTKAAIVTCGGLCPGLNDVIRSIVMALYYRYGVKDVVGVREGYQGFSPENQCRNIALTPESVVHIHKFGGSLLGTSRGRPPIPVIVDALQKMNVSIVFLIGGDGTLRGALDVSEEARKRGYLLSIIGIPKTVDDDILVIDRSFGFQSAFSEGVQSIISANNEAEAAPNGIGLVKLMGRHSGFIACYAALAMIDVNYVLIPEVPFNLEGEDGFLSVLKERILNRRHAVIVVAEGAGQEHLPKVTETDASGNTKLADIGLFLKDRITSYFKGQDIPVNVKYIDPSYIIRSVPAIAPDSVYCMRLGQFAAHAAMAGKTETVIGRVHNDYVHVPMKLIAKGRRQVDPRGDLWRSVLEATGQPSEFGVPVGMDTRS